MKESTQHPNVRPRRCAVVAHAIFDCHRTAVVAAERRIDGEDVRRNVPVHDGEIDFFNRTPFEQPSELRGDCAVPRYDDDTAGFAVETIDEASLGMPEIQAHATDRARELSLSGRVTHEPRGFVDHEEVVILVQDVEERCRGQHAR